MYKVFRVASTDKYSRKHGIFPTKYRIQMINYFVCSSFLGHFRQENNMCVCIYTQIYVSVKNDINRIHMNW